jgi:hypothetical protein
MKLWGTISVDFDITHQLLMDFLHSSDTGEKMGVQYSHRVWNPHEISQAD